MCASPASPTSLTRQLDIDLTQSSRNPRLINPCNHIFLRTDAHPILSWVSSQQGARVGRREGFLHADELIV